MFIIKKIFCKNNSDEVICLSYKQNEFDVNSVKYNNENDASNFDNKVFYSKQSEINTNYLTLEENKSSSFQNLKLEKNRETKTKYVVENSMNQAKSAVDKNKKQKQVNNEQSMVTTKQTNETKINDIKMKNKNSKYAIENSMNQPKSAVDKNKKQKQVNNVQSMVTTKQTNETTINNIKMKNKNTKQGESKNEVQSKEVSNKITLNNDIPEQNSDKNIEENISSNQTITIALKEENQIGTNLENTNKNPVQPRSILKKPKNYPDYQESTEMKYLEETVNSDSQKHPNKQGKMEEENRKNLKRVDETGENVKNNNANDIPINASGNPQTYSSYAQSFFFDNDDSEI